MYSGGSQKEDWSEIYIQASSEEEAIKIFERRFDHHPHRVTCDCCGEDYSISSEKELSNITAFNRNCPWIYEKGKSLEGRYLEGNGKGKGKNKGEKIPDGYKLGQSCGKWMPLKEYREQKNVLILGENDIKSVGMDLM